MKFSKLTAVAAAALALTFTASAANATVWLLDATEKQKGPSPFGTVEVTQNGANQLKFVVTLNSGMKFVDTGAHNAFSFSLDGAPAVTFSGPSGFSLFHSDGAVSNSPFSGFDYGLNCVPPACGNGGSDPYTGPLTFTISGTGLLLSMIGTANAYNGETIRFAADTISFGPGGTTAAVGGGPVTLEINPLGVPEPATWAMLIMGFGMVGAGMRIRRRRNALA